jgi:tRNA dimethylallyltransferase
MLLLVGPTAVGKTRIVEQLAGEPVEIISADAMQVYRRMDIGTAKPPRSLRTAIPHHLIDICNPDDQYDVGRFVRDAETAARDIVSRGRLPVVSGGTAYYAKHLLVGLPAAPESDSAVRHAVADELERRGLDDLRAELERVDPESAERIGPTDAYRITRALEVYRQTGRPLSSFPAPRTIRRDLSVRVFGLRRPRGELTRRIETRVDEMFAAGLYREVEQLLASGYRSTDPGLRAIGYRQFFRPDGTLRSADDTTIRDDVARDTVRYAKRQMTFFRSLPGIEWIDPDDITTVSDAVRDLSGAISAS